MMFEIQRAVCVFTAIEVDLRDATLTAEGEEVQTMQTMQTIPPR